jgi:sugar diacid utilization regulator
MSDNVASLWEAREYARERAVRALAARLAAQKEEVARRAVECWRQEIVDYRSPPEKPILEDEFAFAVENVDALVASLETGKAVQEAHFERAREIAARRVHECVALESFLRAGRVWGRICWETVLSLARTEVPHEREAALDIAGEISRLVDGVATAATGAFLDEIAGRGLLRRDLLDALLTGNVDGEHTQRLARTLHLRLAASYVVVVIRGESVELPTWAHDESPTARRALDRIVEETRRHVRPTAGSLLAGMHNGDLVVLYPTAGRADLEAVRKDCEALAAALGAEVSIGVSGWHDGCVATATAFLEAMEAVKVAASKGIRGRAVGVDEVLVDSMLGSSVAAQRILTETLRPLVEYDAARNGSLVTTLRAYLGARLNITKAAAELFVHPNTVAYRLRRIKDVCGRDPDDPDDLLVLALALKQADVGLVE